MTTSSYQFKICGKSQGVDLRSHLSVYAIEEGLTGWVRNSCNKCVYGMFSGDKEKSDNLANIIKNPNLIIKNIDNKASGLDSSITEIDNYPPRNKQLPKEYVKDFGVDWSFKKDCTDAVSCLPTSYHDCQQTIPIPANVTWTNDCMRYPLGTNKSAFPDCNSLKRDKDGESCFTIKNGEIVLSGKCHTNFAEESFAGLKCCTPFNKTKYPSGREGLFNPPGTLEACSTVQTNISNEPNSYKYPCYQNETSVKKN